MSGDILSRIGAAIDGLCPCGAEPAPGSAWCSEDCRPVPGAGMDYAGERWTMDGPAIRVEWPAGAWRHRTRALAVTIPPEETAAIQQQVAAANPYANVPHYGSGPPTSPFIAMLRLETEIRTPRRNWYTFE